MSDAHAAAVFLRHGVDVDGLMPIDVFANGLFTPAKRAPAPAPPRIQNDCSSI